MHVQELDAFVTDRIKAENLKLTSDDFGAAAAPLVTEWLGGALTVTGVTHSTQDDGTVVLNGTTDLLGVTGRPLTGIEIGLDPADQRPSLFLPFTLPTAWKFPTSFPETKDSDLARLAFAREPEFLLSSTVRPAADGRPPLLPGLTFHGAEVTNPDVPEWLGKLLTLAHGALTLSGPVTRTAGPEKKRRAEITLTSPARGAGVLGASFFLWAGSRTTTADDGTSTVTHPVCLRADLTLDRGMTATVSAPLPTGNGKVAFTAEVLPGEHLPAAVLASWDGSGSAMRQLTGEGFELGDTVLLTELGLVIDPEKLDEGVKEAVTEVTVKAAARPTVAWPVAESVKVTEVGAKLTVTRPLTRERGATVAGYGTFTVTPALRMTASALIPPGTFRLTQDKDTTAKLTDVLKGFQLTAPAGLADLTLSEFSASATPKEGEYSLTAKVATSWSLPLGAAEATLTGAELKLDRKKKKKKEEKEEKEKEEEEQEEQEGEKGKEGAAKEPTDRPDSTHEVTGKVSATAKLGRKGSDKTVDFTAAWTHPGPFALEGKLPDIELTELLDRLSCPLELPHGTPAVSLKGSKATLSASKAVAGQPSGDVHYELGLSTTVAFGTGTQRSVTLTGKAGRSGDGTFFAAALWQQDWSWSPKDVEGWKDVLGILGDLTFRKSGLAICTADGVTLEADAKLPDTLPKKLDRGLTFFSEVGWGESLAFLGEIFPGTEGIRLSARLARPIADSEFTAAIGGEDTGEGFGALSLTIVPKKLKIGLSTTFFLDVSGLASPSGTTLRFVAEGAVEKADTGWLLSLGLVLKADERGGPGVAGQLPPGQLSAVMLDGPGHILLPRTAEPGPAPAEAALPHTVGTLPAVPAVPPVEQRTTWQNAFGIDGFNIAYFYLEMAYSALNGFTLGGGGSVDIGRASLELSVHGRIGNPPSISSFYFSLVGKSRERGVSILDLVKIVAPDPPSALDPLDTVVVRELLLCAVSDPNGWTNRATGQHWEPGFYARGDISLGSNAWEFQVRIESTRLYVCSQVRQPIELGGVFSFASSDGTQGPQFLLDTGNLKQLELPEKIFYLSGSLTLLGHQVLAVEALLAQGGFAFDLTVDIVAAQVEVRCCLNEQGLKASARVDLGFDITLPQEAQIAGLPLPAGLLLGVHVGGEIEVDVTTGAMVRLSGAFSLRAFNATLVDDISAELTFGIRSWSDVVNVLEQDPAKLLEEVVTDVWETAKNCAVTTAGALM
ncbi:hypothetical protein [Streptomyces sp. EN23]|uniref:hypothetical protein n=1 Tax=Streptomyces sp. EN23 TaxID=212774 RepID=UPI000851807B|nr:hypothetical protein [Streptomyces sp. EN23]